MKTWVDEYLSMVKDCERRNTMLSDWERSLSGKKTNDGKIDSLSLLMCVREALALPELVAEFDRLRGTNLSRRGSPLDLMIDDTSGRHAADVEQFIAFVREFIYEPLVDRGMPA